MTGSYSGSRRTHSNSGGRTGNKPAPQKVKSTKKNAESGSSWHSEARSKGNRGNKSYSGDHFGRTNDRNEVQRKRHNHERSASARRDTRPPQRYRVSEPEVPEDVNAQALEASVRRELRALGRVNAENTARHLVMVQRLLDSDPELAYKHAHYAVAHAGRVAVVREAAGMAAYLSGHYQEALRDIRAARRLSGIDLHRAIEADCERALGHLERALKVAKEADPRWLDDVEEAEIAMVVSSIRHELGQDELGLMIIEEAILMFRGDRETLRRLHCVRADRLEELGRVKEAEAIRKRVGVDPDSSGEENEDVEVYDAEEEYDKLDINSASKDSESAVEPYSDKRDELVLSAESADAKIHTNVDNAKTVSNILANESTEKEEN